MAEFVMADPHFGHFNILRYCSRPFGSVEEMDAHIIDRVNSVVDHFDICYWAGDIFFGNVNYGGSIRAKLKGLHYTILGNHDQRSKLTNAGWTVRRGPWVLMVDREEAALRVTHKPDYKFDPMRFQTPTYSLYGHLHNRPHTPPLGGLCISAELLDYTPIALPEALRRCKEKWGEDLRNPLPRLEGLGV